MNMENKYTPELIATSQFKFSIPLYQRLFAWKRKEVTKLLFDLKEHFAKMPADEPYYLGMLTCIDADIVSVPFLYIDYASHTAEQDLQEIRRRAYLG